MATSIKRLCTKCKSDKGVFKCNGCSEIFCWSHTMDHHQHIVEGLTDVEKIRDSVEKVLMEESSKPQLDVNGLHDELTKSVNDWERKSINEIQKMAEKVREEIPQYTTERLNNMKLKLQRLSDELQQSRERNNFIETDLLTWRDKLNQLKEELINPPAVVVQEDYTKLIPNIRVTLLHTQEIFEHSSGNADFAEDGKVVFVSNGPDVYTEVRGRFEYTTGKHTISMKVEQLNGWILFGIISQSTPLQIHSYASSSCYGWYNGQDFNYAAGQNISGHGNDVIQNDTVHLVIDCNERLIRLTNERTGRTEELEVDVEKCPFPWKLHLNLNLVSTRVRILSSTKS